MLLPHVHRVCALVDLSVVDSSPAEDGGDMSDDDYDNFDTVITDKGKSKQKAFEVEAESMTPKELETAMRKEAEYVAGIFGSDVSYSFPVRQGSGSSIDAYSQHNRSFHDADSDARIGSWGN